MSMARERSVRRKRDGVNTIKASWQKFDRMRVWTSHNLGLPRRNQLRRLEVLSDGIYTIASIIFSPVQSEVDIHAPCSIGQRGLLADFRCVCTRNQRQIGGQAAAMRTLPPFAARFAEINCCISERMAMSRWSCEQVCSSQSSIVCFFSWELPQLQQCESASMAELGTPKQYPLWQCPCQSYHYSAPCQ